MTKQPNKFPYSQPERTLLDGRTIIDEISSIIFGNLPDEYSISRETELVRAFILSESERGRERVPSESGTCIDSMLQM